MNFHTLNKNNFHDYREKVACFYQIISRVVINTANVKQKQMIDFIPESDAILQNQNISNLCRKLWHLHPD